MRKVKYNDKENSYHPKDGFFHQWGLCADTHGTDTVGIVEDSTTGQCYYLYPYQFHFVDRPEAGAAALKSVNQ